MRLNRHRVGARSGLELTTAYQAPTTIKTMLQWIRSLGAHSRAQWLATTECARSVTARRANLPHAVGLISPPNQWLPFVVPPSQEGRIAIVTDVESGMRWTRHVIRRMI